MKPVHVIGAGLAGCEAANQLTKRGIPVILHEMRPLKSDAAHKTAYFAELVCSNSLRAGNIENAVGLLKEEMRRLGSLIMEQADKHQVPAGGALAVDRDGFAAGVTEAVRNNPLITVVHEEVTDLQSLEGIVIVASGPLTSDALSANIKEMLREEYFHFFDAAAPIVTADSLDYDKVYRASRYDKGGADYLNCPFYTKEEYVAFWQALCAAESAPVKDFEHDVFEACMPIEEMAARGEDTMRFGPLKPVGLIDPRTGKEAYAVVQLRQDNAAASLYNIVGFQTHLKWPEQRRVFGMIPGLEKAEFVRYGVMHKNTYLNSPQLLDKHFCLRSDKRFYFAGQMTGVEGYVESAASGLMAGIAAARAALELPEAEFPAETAHGALANYISNPAIENFQPMNINFGLIPPLTVRIRKKKEKNAQIAARALEALETFQTLLKK
ncbi:MAG: methylenetetrahydrofolate--tRNA-(uracil(54)-C(5))-methyltransferase (FADH(2)-oxidizing) TrmFO [Phascolarctobacterium sp.]|uniref:methylenetetrahydrofolate--tRNA-(uracil(54)- C(5))-methyltransferase (FADH(2)-oxidizing) TrmFO n=1 Tax=Phascolarctobacterium sp. TaxID=2049039 RepID=UPI0026DBA554|nr:methylenetetrahydrofolate--tRNA-(uracil(54)-C(5))-methyltransferase (FADH(2)-oxidizing) TrmFO [Phascolarctobacterium sp.]MDO4921088.1 methylenetetrahydrofolate--tRNA-(uracil(54)-C(5))-methyltransferase (FADH(2)-oxidizing) TrmFO [Phascolarctobacterium sp.]